MTSADPTDRVVRRRHTVSRLGRAMKIALSSPGSFARGVKLLAGCATPRGRATLVRTLRSISLPPVGRIDYRTWFTETVRTRAMR